MHMSGQPNATVFFLLHSVQSSTVAPDERNSTQFLQFMKLNHGNVYMQRMMTEFTLFTTHYCDNEHDHDGGDEDMTEKLII